MLGLFAGMTKTRTIALIVFIVMALARDIESAHPPAIRTGPPAAAGGDIDWP